MFKKKKNKLVYGYEKTLDFDRNYIKSIDQFGENQHLYYAESSDPWTQHVSSFI